jgi:hypothetical protein
MKLIIPKPKLSLGRATIFGGSAALVGVVELVVALAAGAYATTPSPRWPPTPSSRRWPRTWPTHPGAAASLRESLSETLTVLRLGVPPTLARTLRSTDSIESVISIARTHSRNVKNRQSGNMARARAPSA